MWPLLLSPPPPPLPSRNQPASAELQEHLACPAAPGIPWAPQPGPRPAQSDPFSLPLHRLNESNECENFICENLDYWWFWGFCFFFLSSILGAFKVGQVFLFFPRWVFLPVWVWLVESRPGPPPRTAMGPGLAALPHVLYFFLSKIGILRVEPAVEDSESNLCQKLKVEKRAKENL